jgi:hypothetical protein
MPYKATASESKKDSGSVANSDNGKNEEKDKEKGIALPHIAICGNANVG